MSGAGAPSDTDTVLVVAGDADQRRVLAGMLRPHCTILLAADGRAALHRVRAERPDLVLADAAPDGFELLVALRADPDTAIVPVVLLSARVGEEAAERALAAGADDYLAGPFSAAGLLARVRSTLALARLRSHEGAWRAALVNALQDGLCVMNAAGDVIEINEAFSGMLGYGPEGLPYAVPHPWWPDPAEDPAAAARVAEAMASVQASGSGRSLLPLRHRDGRALWAECSADSVPGRDGRGPLLVSVVRDVTAQRRRADRDRLFAETGRLLGQPGALVERLAAFADLAAPVLADVTVVSLTGPDGRFSPVAAAHRSRPEVVAAVLGLAPHRIPEALVPRYRAGRAFVLDAVPDELMEEASADPDDLAARRRMGTRSSLVAPLLVAGRLLGSLTFASIGAARAHDDADLALADELARRLAGAVDADRIATREHQLFAATAALSAAATVVEAAAALSTAVQSTMGASGIAVYVVDPDDPYRLRLTRADGYPAEVVQAFAVIHTDAPLPVAEAARTGTAVWLGDQEVWLARYPHMAVPGAADDAHAVAALPLQIGGRLLGVLAASFPTARIFAPDERGFALTVATQAAQAMDRAATADARWQIAETLQRSLLPRGLPELPRLALAAHYLPAGRHTQAGGDWYDVITLGPEQVAIVVGDVVGQGSRAAAVMGQLRSGLAAYLLDGHGPAEALARLGRFARRIDGARGSTVVCLVLHTGSGELRWARAGHPPPLVVGPAGARYLDDARGAVLGILDPPPFTEARTTVAPGSSVILYTDGLVERRGELIDEGLGRLAAASGSHHGAGPAELLAVVVDQALDETGAPDDVALIVARLLPRPLCGRCPAVPRQLAAVRRAVATWAAAAVLSVEHVEDLQLAIGEAVANSVEHAYAGATPGWVGYRVEQAGDAGVRVEVTDGGTWRPVPADPGNRGRGLAMIRALGRDVTVDTTGPGTRIGLTVAAPAVVRPAATGAPSRLRPHPATPPAELHVQRDADGQLRLELAGELDLSTVGPLRSRLVEQLLAETGGEPIVLDTRGVTYLSSAGVGLLLDATHAAPERLRLLVGPGTAAARILELTGLEATWETPPSAPDHGGRSSAAAIGTPGR